MILYIPCLNREKSEYYQKTRSGGTEMKQKERKLCICIACIMAAAFMTAAGIAFSSQSDPAAAAISVSAENGNEADTVYTLREHLGMIAVFIDGSNEPMLITDIDVAGLREYDRQQLVGGIGAATYEDVLRFLEDFGS